MAMVMDPGLVIVLVLFVPLAFLVVLRRTRFAWLPGVLLIAGAFVLFAMIEPVHDDVGGIGALGNGVMALAAIGGGTYGLVLLAIGASLSGKRRRPQMVTLPVATVVAGVSKPD